MAIEFEFKPIKAQASESKETASVPDLVTPVVSEAGEESFPKAVEKVKIAAHATLIPEVMKTESSESKSDLSFTLETISKDELEAVEVLPYVEEEGEDSNFSAKREPKKKQIKKIKDKSFSTKFKSAVGPETVDAEPIMQEEEDSDFSNKRKPKKTQVQDIASHSEVKLKPSIEEEIVIEQDVNVKTERITIESGVVAKPRKNSIKTITEEAQSSDFIPSKQSSDETKIVETESITIESGILTKPRKKSIKKTVEQSESISIEQETKIVARKKSKNKCSKSDHSEESLVVTVLNRKPSSKL